MRLRNKTKQVREVRDLQGRTLTEEPDDYMVGLYDGLELALSILEERKPEYKTVVREPKVIEREENKEEQKLGRTVASGIRRR